MPTTGASTLFLVLVTALICSLTILNNAENGIEAILNRLDEWAPNLAVRKAVEGDRRGERGGADAKNGDSGRTRGSESVKELGLAMLRDGKYRSSMILFQELHTEMSELGGGGVDHSLTVNYLASTIMNDEPRHVLQAVLDTAPHVRQHCFLLGGDAASRDQGGDDHHQDGPKPGQCADMLTNFAIALEITYDAATGSEAVAAVVAGSLDMSWDSHQRRILAAHPGPIGMLYLAERCYLRALVGDAKDNVHRNLEELRKRVLDAEASSAAGSGGVGGSGGGVERVEKEVVVEVDERDEKEESTEEPEGEKGGEGQGMEAGTSVGGSKAIDSREDTDVLLSLRKKVKVTNKTPSFHYALVSMLLPSIRVANRIDNGVVEEVMEVLHEAITLCKELGNTKGAEKGEGLIDDVMNLIMDGGGARGEGRDDTSLKNAAMKNNGENEKKVADPPVSVVTRNSKHEVEKLKLEVEIQRLELKLMEQQVLNAKSAEAGNVKEMGIRGRSAASSSSKPGRESYAEASSHPSARDSVAPRAEGRRIVTKTKTASVVEPQVVVAESKGAMPTRAPTQPLSRDASPATAFAPQKVQPEEASASSPKVQGQDEKQSEGTSQRRGGIRDDGQSTTEKSESLSPTQSDGEGGEGGGEGGEGGQGEGQSQSQSQSQSQGQGQGQGQGPVLYTPREIPVPQPPLPAAAASYMKMANAYIDRSDFYSAVKQFAKVLKKSPDHLPALIGRATFLDKLKNDLSEVAKAYADAARVAVDLRNAELAGKLFERVVATLQAMPNATDRDIQKLDEVAKYSLQFVDRESVAMELQELVRKKKQRDESSSDRKGGIMGDGGSLGSADGGGSLFSQPQQQEGTNVDPLGKLEEGAKNYVEGEFVNGEQGAGGSLPTNRRGRN